MRRLLLVLLPLLLAGCIKRAEPPQAATPIPVGAVFLLDQEDAVAVLEAPDELIQAATAVLDTRNLQVDPLPASRWAESFASKRSTRQRMLELLERAPQDTVLLVETRAQLASLMEGRYRWTVPTTLTLARRGAADFPVQATVEVPVFLRYPHQDADDAVAAATTVLSKRLGRMADELLAADAVREAARSQQRPAQAQAPVSDRADAVYFVMVDRFRNGDPSNDGAVDRSDPQAFHGGDLRGVIDDVPRLAALGFRTVWLSPVWDTRDERIGPWGAFHGYWVEDPGAVEPRFGTEAELRELRDALDARGMGLVLDFVANHVAPDAALRDERPDWFHHAGEITDWSDPEQVVTHDVHGLPDLAQENPEVTDWLLGHATRWQQTLQPEGFRLDAVRHVPSTFWRALSDALRAEDRHVTLVGELFDGDPAAVAASWQGGGFSGMFDFPLHYALLDVACDGQPPGRLASALQADAEYPDPTRLWTFLDNHDLPRAAARCDRAELDQALALLLSVRGRPVITWGTELGLDGAEEPANRADFDWDAARPWESVLAQGLALRAEWSGLRAAERRFLALDDELVAWVQADGGGAALIALNRGATERTLALPRLEPPETRWVEPRREVPVTGEVTVPPGGLGVWTARARSRGGFHGWLDAPPPTHDVTVRVTGAPGPVALVGAGERLGRWNPADGVLTRADGADQVASLSVPEGSVLEYKLVAGDAWEPRAQNRYLLVTGPAEVTAAWGS